MPLASDITSTLRTELKHYSVWTPKAQARPVGPPYTIRASIRVRAETRRLFQALVIPEYIETWLSVPYQEASWSLTPLQTRKGFVLECSDRNARMLRILAGFTAWRRRRLSIRWKLEGNRQLNESSVAVRVVGDFECSILSLCHTGLDSLEDFRFHQQLWSGSLDRLGKLFRGISCLENAIGEI